MSSILYYLTRSAIYLVYIMFPICKNHSKISPFHTILLQTEQYVRKKGPVRPKRLQSAVLASVMEKFFEHIVGKDPAVTGSCDLICK